MIYRVGHVNEVHTGSQGFCYFGTKKEAEADRREQLSKYTSEEIESESVEVEIEARATPKNKAEMVELLQSWGSHPDNG